jgi:putative PIN family toxin of toxin-antitoxin system
MKILFDTNVLIAAFIGRGYSYEVVEDSIHGHALYSTPFIIKEFKKTFKNKFRYPESMINELVGFTHNFFIQGKTGQTINQICRDTRDNHILADAVINGIDIIITGDKDLLALKNYKGIKIISPKEYWNL